MKDPIQVEAIEGLCCEEALSVEMNILYWLRYNMRKNKRPKLHLGCTHKDFDSDKNQRKYYYEAALCGDEHTVLNKERLQTQTAVDW